MINFLISVPLYARTVEHKTVDFPVKAEALLNGEIHYFFAILSPRKLAVQYPIVFELDSLSLLQENDVMMVVTKTVNLVNKPIGFFEEKQLLDEKYFSHIMGDQKIKKLSLDSYQIEVPGKESYTYKIQSFFDSDDISTLPNSRIIRAVSAAKKLDVISQSASTIMFTEKTNFTKYTHGGVTVSSFIPMKENKTLVISYNLWAVKKKFANKESLKTSFIKEIEAVKSLQEDYK
ncbi:MAG: hypothetical protein ACLGHN_07225 [Bacteriovoracia bacterium]